MKMPNAAACPSSGWLFKASTDLLTMESQDKALLHKTTGSEQNS